MVNNITAERLLAGKIDADEQFTLIDVRPEDSFEGLARARRGERVV